MRTAAARPRGINGSTLKMQSERQRNESHREQVIVRYRRSLIKRNSINIRITHVDFFKQYMIYYRIAFTVDVIFFFFFLLQDLCFWRNLETRIICGRDARREIWT